MPGDTSADKNKQISAANANSNPSKGNTEDDKKEIEYTASKENVQGAAAVISLIRSTVQTSAGNVGDTNQSV